MFAIIMETFYSCGCISREVETTTLGATAKRRRGVITPNLTFGLFWEYEQKCYTQPTSRSRCAVEQNFQDEFVVKLDFSFP